MDLGMSLQIFTLIHVLISLAGIASGIVVLYGFLTNKKLDKWTAVFLGATALTSFNRVPVSIQGNDPSDQAGNHLSGGAGNQCCDALPSTPCVAENLRDYSMRGFVLQRFRSRGSVIRESAAVKGYCSDAKRATICDSANFGVGTFHCPDDPCREEIPH
jgi:hypothetical protein